MALIKSNSCGYDYGDRICRKQGRRGQVAGWGEGGAE